MWDWSGSKQKKGPVRARAVRRRVRTSSYDDARVPGPEPDLHDAPRYYNQPAPSYQHGPQPMAPYQNGHPQQPPYNAPGAPQGYQQAVGYPPYSPEMPHTPAPIPMAPQPYAPDHAGYYPDQPQAHMAQPPTDASGAVPHYLPPRRDDASSHRGGPGYVSGVAPKGEEMGAAYRHREQDRSVWEAELARAGLPGMSLEEFQFVRLDENWKNKMRAAFKRARRDFLKYVGYHHEAELMAAGVNDEGLRELKRGRSPENFNVHLKVPLDYSGSNDFSNLVLIQTHPYHENIHKFIDKQLAQVPAGRRARALYIPVPPGKVYVPEGGDLSGGGKDMEDRSVYAGFLEKNFQQITIKRRFGGMGK